MARRDQTRRRILDAAYDLFYRDGFARVGVDEIAEQAGVAKRTLYDHFPSKDALIEAALTLQAELARARIALWASRDFASRREMIVAIFDDFIRWASRPKWRGAGFTRAAMEFAGLPGHPARHAAHVHKLEVEQALAALFVRHGVADSARSARETTLLLEGCGALIVIHGDCAYAEAAREAALRLVASEESGGLAR